VSYHLKALSCLTHLPYTEIYPTDTLSAKRGIEHWVDCSPEQPLRLLSGHCVSPALAVLLLDLMQKFEAVSLWSALPIFSIADTFQCAPEYFLA